MTRVLTVSASYSRDADSVFDDAIRFSEMIEATKGVATYVGLPDEDMEEGRSYEVYVTVFGVMHNPRYQIHVETVDPIARRVQSREMGRAIRTWDHTLAIDPLPGGGCRWTDRIVIDSGWLTGFMVRVARYMYVYRHRSRAASDITATIARP